MEDLLIRSAMQETITKTAPQIKFKVGERLDSAAAV
jgi:hypothetical protein